MSKPIWIVVSLLLLQNTASAQGPKSDWLVMKLNGKIKTIYENIYSQINDSGRILKGNLVNIIQMNFNPEGYLTEEIVNNSDWQPIYKTIYFYTENKLTHSELFARNGMLQYKNVFQHDTKNNTVRKKQYLGNGDLFVKSQYEYNESGNLKLFTETNVVNPKDSYTEAYSYDHFENLIETKNNQRDMMLNREICEYDSFGVLIRKTYFNKDQPYIAVDFIYEFDKLLNWTRCTEIPSSKDWDQCYIRERNIAYY